MLGDLTPDQIEHVLGTEIIGRLGCHSGGRTYVIPITFAYDGSDVYGHSGPGMKIRMMRAEPKVCFGTEHVEGMANWQSVKRVGPSSRRDPVAARPIRVDRDPERAKVSSDASSVSASSISRRISSHRCRPVITPKVLVLKARRCALRQAGHQ